MEALARRFLLFLARSKRMARFMYKYGMRVGAGRFVAGQTLEEAVERVRQLNAMGILATLDHLGESITHRSEAEEAAAECVKILDAIKQSGVNSNLSLKLTQLGLDIDQDLSVRNMEMILGTALKYNNFVRIDMEDSAHCQVTVDIFRRLKAEYGDHVGLVVQSYLYRTMDDVKDLSTNLRIVKGAYREPKEVAFPLKHDVDENYVKLVEANLKMGNYTAVATHDERIIERTLDFVKREGIPGNLFEFQMLYGIRTGLQKQLIEKGYRVRVYVPYGQDWYPYFMRRLAERPANVWFLVKNFFRK